MRRLKTVVPPEIVTISYPVMEKFVSKIQSHLTHSAEVIVRSQVSISLLNSKIGDVPEYHTTLLVAMGDIMKKLIVHGSVLEKFI